MTQKRLILIVGGALAALLVAILVVVLMVFNQMRADAENRAYQQCMARYGYAADEGAVVPPDEQDAYIDSLVAAAEACSKP